MITVTINRSQPSPRGGGIIWAQDGKTGQQVRIIANTRSLKAIDYHLPDTGETYAVCGDFEDHETYGRQFMAWRFRRHALTEEQQKQEQTSNRNTIRMLTFKPYFRNIGLGEAKIAHLDEAYPDGRLAETLERVAQTGDLEPLTSVRGIGPALAARIRDQWAVHLVDAELSAFLDRHGIDSRLSTRIIKGWGDQALEHIRKNPYRLTLFTTWENADDIARNKMDVAPDDKRRQIAAVANVLWRRADKDGHTWISADDLHTQVKELLTVREIPEYVADDVTAHSAIKAALDCNVIVGDASQGYQQLGPFELERTVAERIDSIIASVFHPKPQASLLGWDSVSDREIDQLLDEFEALERQAAPEHPIKLTQKQRLAVQMTVLEPFSMVLGYAGCGKTTVQKAIRYVANAIHCKMFQMALAGRAAQRMREVTGAEADTIMGFIYKRMKRQIDLGGAPLLSLDECSMVDLPLLRKLTKHLPLDVRMSLVGDTAQLGPISFGKPFHDLATNPNIPKVILDEVLRNAEDSMIPYVARDIREGRPPELHLSFEIDGPDVCFIPCNQRQIMGNIEDVIRMRKGFKGIQIIGSVADDKGRGGGTISINRRCQMLYADGDVMDGRGSDDMFVEGDPIIFLENDYDRLIFNGTAGVIESIDHARRIILCRFDSAPNLVEIDWADHHLIDLAYAITTHKAQGSQYDTVIIPIFESQILDRSLIYTALTRAISKVVFVGDIGVFERAIRQAPKVDSRQVGPAFRNITVHA